MKTIKILLIGAIMVVCVVLFIFLYDSHSIDEKGSNDSYTKDGGGIKNETSNDNYSKSEHIKRDNYNRQAYSNSVREYIAVLMTSNNPSEKRRIREEIVRLQPTRDTLTALLRYYNSSSDDEKLKLHLQSIITQIDASSVIPEVKEAASTTADDALFVSLVYSLRNVNNEISKRALLELVEENQLAEVNQGTGAIRAALTDTTGMSDMQWLSEVVENKNLSDPQVSIIVDMLSQYPSDGAIETLYKVKYAAESPELIIRIDQAIENMQKAVEYVGFRTIQ